MWPAPGGVRIPHRQRIHESSVAASSPLDTIGASAPGIVSPPVAPMAPTRCLSHVWGKRPRYSNLTWTAPPEPSKMPAPAHAAEMPAPDIHDGERLPDGDRLVQVQVPLPRRLRRRGRPGALELCCGHAGLTAALCDAGLDACGVDWAKNKHQPAIPILHVDLTSPEGQHFIMQMLEDLTLMYVHMGPPCGTFTRARERPIPEHLREQNAPNPQPLRSDQRPEGLSPRHLTPLDSLKVEKGNVIAEFCARVAQYCLDNGKLFTIENPTGSLLWKLPAYTSLIADDRVASVDFHACMWGSRRDKRTSFVTNMPQMEALRKTCDGSHEHAPWGLRWNKGWRFATEEECEYPKPLCEAAAKAAATATDAPRRSDRLSDASGSPGTVPFRQPSGPQWVDNRGHTDTHMRLRNDNSGRRWW